MVHSITAFHLFVVLAAVPCASLKLAVAGATGRTGRLVVERAVAAGHEVTALVRNVTKAKEVLPPAMAMREIDLATATGADMREACEGSERLLWCASGFTEDMQSIDLRGMKELVPGAIDSTASTSAPIVVMLSSAGVSRPSWDDAKKERLVGASDIPIIRLNPGGILDKKAEAEQVLRDSGMPYCVVRPTGLKFEGWPQGRPILSQGDVAVGRTNVLDLAAVLVDILDEPDARGKTFELFTLAGYPAATALGPNLRRLAPDAAGPLAEAAVDATYDALQQLLPGEEQDATKLEMGRTYEQVDQGVVVPRAPGAAPTQREIDLAAGVAGGTSKRGIRGFVGRLLRR